MQSLCQLVSDVVLSFRDVQLLAGTKAESPRRAVQHLYAVSIALMSRVSWQPKAGHPRMMMHQAGRLPLMRKTAEAADAVRPAALMSCLPAELLPGLIPLCAGGFQL